MGFRCAGSPAIITTMDVEASNISCGDCGLPLRVEYAQGEVRPPCPNCGSTVRRFHTPVTTIDPILGASVIPASVAQALEEIAEAEPGDVQQIASGQIRLLTSYYDTALQQAQRSFTWALVAAGVGLACFLAAVMFLLVAQGQQVALVSSIGGALVEVLAGVNFFLYRKSTAQLAVYHDRLDQTQRFLLANSICESLEGEVKNTTRAALVATITKQAQTPDPQ